MRSRIILALLFLLCSGFFARSSFGLDKLRVGLSSVSALHGALWVAEEKGLFKKHGIDAAVLTIPSVFIADERGLRVLADLADMDIYYLHTMMDTSRSFLRSNRDQALRFIKGFVEGIAFFKKNKRESIEVLKKKLRTDAKGEKYLEKSYDLLAGGYYESVPYPSMQGVETLLQFMEKENPKAKTADPKSFVDSSIVAELEASGFIKALYEK